MKMHNPPHPGGFIYRTYLEPYNLSCRYVASKLGVSNTTLSRLINENSGISPEMALRLSKVLGRSAESWLAMQDIYDLHQANKISNLKGLRKIDLATAWETVQLKERILTRRGLFFA